MTTIFRPRLERGHFDHGWLNSYHTFSFGNYVDPDWHQFRALRVINEDVVVPGQGFGMHPHRDMEILTWVLEGELEHRDSLGHGATLSPGEMQWMSAGAGIRHSEFNPSSTDPVHLYQIWLTPDRQGYPPTYAQTRFPESGRRNRLQVVAAPDGRDGALPIRQDAVVSVGNFDACQRWDHELAPGRHGWLQVLRGDVTVAAQLMTAGDAIGFSDESGFRLEATSPAEVMVFDLP